eukprot:m.1141573 g.1141573  ORF g.1141573 m.1141573 type:complete len:95 (+) comp24449_c0_seq29:3013-3297(+)
MHSAASSTSLNIFKCPASPRSASITSSGTTTSISSDLRIMFVCVGGWREYDMINMYPRGETQIKLKTAAQCLFQQDAGDKTDTTAKALPIDALS